MPFWLKFLSLSKISRPPDPGSFAPEICIIVGCMRGWRPDEKSEPFVPIYLSWILQLPTTIIAITKKNNTTGFLLSFVLSNSTIGGGRDCPLFVCRLIVDGNMSHV